MSLQATSRSGTYPRARVHPGYPGKVTHTGPRKPVTFPVPALCLSPLLLTMGTRVCREGQKDPSLLYHAPPSAMAIAMEMEVGTKRCAARPGPFYPHCLLQSARSHPGYPPWHVAFAFCLLLFLRLVTGSQLPPAAGPILTTLAPGLGLPYPPVWLPAFTWFEAGPKSRSLISGYTSSLIATRLQWYFIYFIFF